MLFEELLDLFPSPSNGTSSPFTFDGADTANIAIRGACGNISARVTIDEQSDLYVFCELDGAAGIVLTTASEERLLDEIVNHLCGGVNNVTPHTVTSAVSVLVGQTMRDIERKLIFQTLRHCSGDLTHAAFILDITLTTLRSKLAVYFAQSQNSFDETANDPTDTNGGDPH